MLGDLIGCESALAVGLFLGSVTVGGLCFNSVRLSVTEKGDGTIDSR